MKQQEALFFLRLLRRTWNALPVATKKALTAYYGFPILGAGAVLYNSFKFLEAFSSQIGINVAHSLSAKIGLGRDTEIVRSPVLYSRLKDTLSNQLQHSSWIEPFHSLESFRALILKAGRSQSRWVESSQDATPLQFLLDAGRSHVSWLESTDSSSAFTRLIFDNGRCYLDLVSTNKKSSTNLGELPPKNETNKIELLGAEGQESHNTVFGGWLRSKGRNYFHPCSSKQFLLPEVAKPVRFIQPSPLPWFRLPPVEPTGEVTILTLGPNTQYRLVTTYETASDGVSVLPLRTVVRLEVFNPPMQVPALDTRTGLEHFLEVVSRFTWP